MGMSPDNAKRVIADMSHTSGTAEMTQKVITFVCCVSYVGSAWRHVELLKTCTLLNKMEDRWICLFVLFIFAAGWQILIKFSTESLRWLLCGYLSFVSVGLVWILIYMELDLSFAWLYFLENNPCYEAFVCTLNTDLVITYSFYWNTLRSGRY